MLLSITPGGKRMTRLKSSQTAISIFLILIIANFCVAGMAPGYADSEINGGRDEDTVTEQTSPDDAGEDIGVETESGELLPGYSVAQFARDPFFPADAQTPGETASKQLTDSDILSQALATLNMSGIIGRDAETGSIIINGELYQIGEAVEVDLSGKKYEIKLINIQFRPSGVVFAYNDETTLVLLGEEEAD